MRGESETGDCFEQGLVDGAGHTYLWENREYCVSDAARQTLCYFCNKNTLTLLFNLQPIQTQRSQSELCN